MPGYKKPKVRASLLSEAIYQEPGQPSPHVDGVVVYKAKLCRQDSESLGLTVAPPKDSMMNLLIIDVKDSPAIQNRNPENLEAIQQIQVGHAILAVNGKTDPLLMMDQLASAKTLNLLLKDRLTRPQKRYFEESFQVYTQRQRQQLQELVGASSMATWQPHPAESLPDLSTLGPASQPVWDPYLGWTLMPPSEAFPQLP